jgi:hypothetical protein
MGCDAVYSCTCLLIRRSKILHVCATLKMEAMTSCEPLETTYKTTQRNNPE